MKKQSEKKIVAQSEMVENFDKPAWLWGSKFRLKNSTGKISQIVVQMENFDPRRSTEKLFL